MTDYTALATLIETIVKKDYSGCLDKAKTVDENSIILSENCTRNEFYEASSTYLRRFKDHHLNLIDTSDSPFSNGFVVRRYQDTLVVSEVFRDIALNLNDRITHIDGCDIQTLAKHNSSYFFSEDPTRQNWRVILLNANTITYTREEQAYHYDLERFEPMVNEPLYSCTLHQDIPILTFSDFNNEEAIAQVIQDNRTLILDAEALIIDVRKNAGGSDLSYFPLLEFIFDSHVDINDLSQDTMAVLYSARNCDLRTAMLKDVLKSSPDLPEHLVAYIDNELHLYQKNYDKGFVTETEDAIGFEIIGSPTPKHVVILSDQYCGSSGDSFVKLAKLSPKVKVIGRNTMGVLDYSNVSYQPLEDHFTLMYPTSRMNSIDEGKGIDNIGIAPDIIIPWTPRHLSEDVDLLAALEFIRSPH